MFTPLFMYSSSHSPSISSQCLESPNESHCPHIRWEELATNLNYIWGIYQGNQSSPYRVRIDLNDPQGTCSCPSRQTQCKHIRSLLILFEEYPHLFSTSTPFPKWLKRWIRKRNPLERIHSDPIQLSLPFMKSNGPPSSPHQNQNLDSTICPIFKDNLALLQQVEPSLNCCLSVLKTLFKKLNSLHSSTELSSSFFFEFDSSFLHDLPSLIETSSSYPKTLPDCLYYLNQLHQRLALMNLPLLSWDLKTCIHLLSSLNSPFDSHILSDSLPLLDINQLTSIFLFIKRLHWTVNHPLFTQFSPVSSLDHSHLSTQITHTSILWDLFHQLGCGLTLSDPTHKSLLPIQESIWLVGGHHFQYKAHLIQVETWIFDLKKHVWLRYLSFFSKALWDQGNRPYLIKSGTQIRGVISSFFGAFAPRCTWNRHHVDLSEPTSPYISLNSSLQN